ncbi:mediator complex, subunit Med18 [Plectosphaerella plurivora]|uniref:Mediator of RNA polymerase II transcription subunit 18 n=1 Tax=Plectosphaerella plurivora TaxID=936078 RepID=A0A9P8VA99_9PEZI|nr:mediator complex, subunit Med18 [Plectosphaerella plurivora]
MYDIFLSSIVQDEDIKATCSILSGLCAMPAWESLHRVLYFKGPARPNGISNQSSIVKTGQRKDTIALWKELHQQLSRQSYVVQARFEVFKDKDFGNATPANFDAQPGVLRWTDFPDPPQKGAGAGVTQRKRTEIWEQRNLPSIMRDNNYLLKSEAIEEVYQFFRDDVEFVLFRHYALPPSGDGTPLATVGPWETTFTPTDPGRRWIFLIKVHVLQDNKPDEILKAHEQLNSIRRELEGVFDFKTYDRRIHDTRIAVEMRNAPAPLPQVMTAGMS